MIYEKGTTKSDKGISKLKSKLPVVVFITALSVEYKAVRNHLKGLKEETHSKGTVYERGIFNGYIQKWEVGIVEIGPGNERAALETERACNYFQPEIIFFVGVAGGIKDVKIGDVVAASKIYGYESGSAEEEFMPRPNMGITSYALEQRARAEVKKGKWIERSGQIDSTLSTTGFVGPIAAGEKVVKSKRSSIYQFLQKNYGDALAVEMEGIGFLQASHANMSKSMVIRGISDLIDKKDESDDGGSQEFASRNAAAFAFEMLANLNFQNTNSKQYIHETQNEILAESDFWKHIGEVATELYPRGPEDNAVWSRADGDMSTIVIQTTGKASWFDALSRLRLGGGGHSINIIKLLNVMLDDFPDNENLKILKSSLD